MGHFFHIFFFSDLENHLQIDNKRIALPIYKDVMLSNYANEWQKWAEISMLNHFLLVI